MTLPELTAEVRNILEGLKPGEVLSTNQLAAEIVARGDTFDTGAAVKEIYIGLVTLAQRELADSWRPGQVVMRFGRPAHPKQWFKPTPKLCPHCHGQL